MDKLDVIWQKAKAIATEDPDIIRVDEFGNMMKKESFGKFSPMGWTVLPINPTVKGDLDTLENLKPVSISVVYNSQSGKDGKL